LRDYAAYALDFLADPTFFTVLDTYGIELIHPRREGRSKRQIGKKGKSVIGRSSHSRLSRCSTALFT
jgi:hypothetical protein